MIIKATQLQEWAPAGGGAKVDRRPPPPLEKKNFLGYIGDLFATFFYMGAFLLRFSHFGGLFTMHVGAFFATFYFMVEAFFGLAPPPIRKILRAPMIARRVREHAPRTFFCVTTI